MLHPIVVASVALLLANDHVFKLRWPSVVTGKLSDVAGLVFFPVLLFSLAEMWSAVLRRRAPSPSILVGCIFVSGIVFASAEVAPSFERVLEATWGALASPRDAISGSSSPVAMVADPSDLVALPALWVAWRVAARRRLPSESAEEGFRRIALWRVWDERSEPSPDRVLRGVSHVATRSSPLRPTLSVGGGMSRLITRSSTDKASQTAGRGAVTHTARFNHRRSSRPSRTNRSRVHSACGSLMSHAVTRPGL
jgi:hypothetical protein